jgi:hypothetical protein
MTDRAERKLSAILAADIEGYSRLGALCGRHPPLVVAPMEPK